MSYGEGVYPRRREPYLLSDATWELGRVVHNQSVPEYVGRHHSGFDGKRFVVAVRRWELTPGQVVFGVWIVRESGCARCNSQSSGMVR